MRLSSKASFVIALIVLGTCAMGLESASAFLKLHFRKEAVPLRQPVESIPARFGSWVQVTPDTTMGAEMERYLGTKEYVTRGYVDTSVVAPGLLDNWKNKTEDEQKVILADIQQNAPEAIVWFMFTYYTGLADTVAHVPDRCYIADGYNVASADVLQWPASGKTVRYLTFEDAAGMGRVHKNVAYCFSVNGESVADPIDVRRIMGNLFAKYGYYAKIELMTQNLERDKAAPAMDRFLAAAMPALEQVLPDWSQYKGK